MDKLRQEFDFTFPKYVYVSGALTDMSDEERDRLKAFYEALGRVCHECGFKAYLPHVFSDPKLAPHLTPEEVDEIDRLAVMLSYIVVAYVGVPSLGPGIEVEMAYHAYKPVVLLCEKDTLDARRISRLARGNPAITKIIVFTDFNDALAQFRAFLPVFKEKIGRKEYLPIPLRP